MKKPILLFTLLILTLTAVAQETRNEWGIRVGANFAKEIAKNDGTKFRTSAHFALYREYEMNYLLGIQPEIMYSMQGGRDSYGYTDMLDYLLVPVMFKLYMVPRKFSVDLGLYVGLMLNGKVKHNGSKEDIKGLLTRWDVGPSVGLTFRASPRFDLTCRTSYGLLKLEDRLENRNAVIHLGVGYRFWAVK
ncbi:MAG: PorT family protein [Rikenellaceae bacterium]|nr:PorT family protein [Rikenellaceae bacterium]